MSKNTMPAPLVAIAQSGMITAQDVLTMRREAFWDDDKIDRQEAEWLMAIDRSAQEKSREWQMFFSEAIVDHIVHQTNPQGRISEDNADWLISSMAQEGMVDGAASFEMLVKVLEAAHTSPDSLVRFALEQVGNAVRNNAGPLCTDERMLNRERHVITKADVEQMRRIMYAFGGDGGMAITKSEAEFLFNLNDKTHEFDNDPAWSDFFVRAIGNYVMATMGGTMLSRKAVLEADTWMEGEGLFDKLTNSLRSVFSTAMSGTAAVETAMEQTNDARLETRTKAEEINHDEAKWISNRIGADGILHQNEKALLHFIEKESHSIHPSLKDLIARAA